MYFLYVGLSAVARWLPESFTYRLAAWVGDVAARRSKKREQVARNLSRIVGRSADSPEVQALVVEAFRSYTRYWLETFRLVREDADFFLERFQAPTEHNLFDPARNGRGVVVVIGHLGNWDAAGAWVAANGFRLVTVAEVLKPRRMFDFFIQHRARLGMTIYPAEKGVTSRLIEDVRAGAVVAILGDRDLKGTGPEATFFGERATFPGGAASMVIETGAALVVAGVYAT
ncbi:MAG: phosphatidylinositol mannoside acyltransferase, partial [Actinobacteria bacterium]|nr:phosphatidylinositol mannoside acyltransferase [Actinomycetota bacterium]